MTPKVKVISPEEKVAMVSDASLIYFCGERLMRDIAEGNIHTLIETLDKVDKGTKRLRDKLWSLGYK